GAAHHPLHRQGRSRQDERGRRHRAPVRCGGPEHGGRIDRPRAQPLGLAGDRARRCPHSMRRPSLGPGGSGSGRDGTPLGGGPGMDGRSAGRARRRSHLCRGADGAARDGRALLAARDQTPPRGGPLRRDHRRLRAHRRDPAPALLSRRRELVAREGLPVGAAADLRRAADRPRTAGHSAAERRRLRRRAAAGREPRRHERDPARPRLDLGAARDESRSHGGEGVDAHLHLPQPLRLSDGRDRGQPRPSRGSRRGLLRTVARGPARADGASALGLLPGSRARRSRARARGNGHRDARPPGRRAVRRGGGRSLGRPARGDLPRARLRERHRPSAPASARSVQGRHRTQEDRARARDPGRSAQAHDHPPGHDGLAPPACRELRRGDPRGPLRARRRWSQGRAGEL
ncbi:MAG: Arsenical pump-driving ATPase TEMP, partial [uncultured Solirubrobacterales bacterium]